MTATFRFTVTGDTHADILAEAHRVATAYWGGRNRYDIDVIDADEGYRGGITAHVTTKAHGVAG